MPQNKNRKNEWVNKPRSEWTEEDWDDYQYSQNHKKPIRFQFSPDATEEDIDRFLDTIFGPEQKKNTDG